MSDSLLFRDQSSFLGWVGTMGSVIDNLRTRVGPAIAQRLNFEIETLDALEAWLNHTFSDYRELLLPENADAYDGAARYFGEVLRRAVGGEWVACLEDERSSTYGYPTIDNYPGRSARIMPHFCITATIDRRQGNYLSSIVKRAQQSTR